MNFDNKEDRIKFLKLVVMVLGGCLIVGYWIATQMVASACGYSPLLKGGIHIGGIGIYFPLMYFVWSNDPALVAAIPDIINSGSKWPWICGFPALIGLVYYARSQQKLSSHGTAAFASAKDMDKSILGPWVDPKDHSKGKKKSGVVVGRNPFTHELMLDYEPTHILVAAPTRSGKGVGPVLSTGICWRDSIFFFDPKGEIWQHTSGYRKKVLKQKVIKFQPLCADGTAARWNPLAEIDFRTPTETKDLDIIVDMLINPKGEDQKGDSFWPESNRSVFKCVILHLMYKHYKEGKDIPTLSDIISFLTSPGKTIKERFTDLVTFPHITVEEYIQEPNVFEINYPKDYILDFNAFEEHLQYILQSNGKIPEGTEIIIKSQKELKQWIMKVYNDEELRDEIDFTMEPYNVLLTNPTVSSCATDLLNVADSEQTLASIMKGAVACLNLYQNPLVQTNTAASDFRIKDLKNPDQPMSCYFIMEPNDIDLLRPLARLFVNTLLGKLQRDMDARVKKKQRLLLLLDEFPRLGKMEAIEAALAICAGYGIKICLIVQNLGQITKLYTKDNEILSNCNVQVFFAPKEIDTAEWLSKSMGSKTIKSTSHSDGGGLFKGSNTISNQSRKLMEPDEILRLPWEKSIILVGGMPPFLADKVFFYDIPFLQNRLESWKQDKPKYPLIEISDFGTQLDSYDRLMESNETLLRDLIDKRRSNAELVAKKKRKDTVRNEEEIKSSNAETEALEELETFQTTEIGGGFGTDSWLEGTGEVGEGRGLSFNDNIDDLLNSARDKMLEDTGEEESANG